MEKDCTGSQGPRWTVALEEVEKEKRKKKRKVGGRWKKRMMMILIMTTTMMMMMIIIIVYIVSTRQYSTAMETLHCSLLRQVVTTCLLSDLL
jgi:cell division protein FtsL